jgi:hypothetical protein
MDGMEPSVSDKNFIILGMVLIILTLFYIYRREFKKNYYQVKSKVLEIIPFPGFYFRGA